jgi:hypothetical protein
LEISRFIKILLYVNYIKTAAEKSTAVDKNTSLNNDLQSFEDIVKTGSLHKEKKRSALQPVIVMTVIPHRPP